MARDSVVIMRRLCEMGAGGGVGGIYCYCIASPLLRRLQQDLSRLKTTLAYEPFFAG